MSRILIVDDEKNVLTTLSMGLRRCKHTVLQARSGDEALDLMGREACDVVVSDIRMSPMDGYRLAERIVERYPEVSIVFMTAYDFDEDHESRYLKLASYCLTKPFEVSSLADVIKKVEKSRKKGKVLVIAEAGDGVRIRHITQSAGYWTDIADAEKDIEERIRRNDYELFLVDGDYLNGQEWMMLNDIDRLAPSRPVILLSRKGGMKETAGPSELGIIYMDRKTFLEEPETARHLLRHCFGNFGNG